MVVAMAAAATVWAAAATATAGVATAEAVAMVMVAASAMVEEVTVEEAAMGMEAAAVAAVAATAAGWMQCLLKEVARVRHVGRSRCSPDHIHTHCTLRPPLHRRSRCRWTSRSCPHRGSLLAWWAAGAGSACQVAAAVTSDRCTPPRRAAWRRCRLRVRREQSRWKRSRRRWRAQRPAIRKNHQHPVRRGARCRGRTGSSTRAGYARIPYFSCWTAGRRRSRTSPRAHGRKPTGSLL
mmetsp:Transcript_25641/g.56162  ORF Transcript_25641/g.56162 Transcript_25641/m.56162 type:complete len:237 (+) Transcript_25641:1343-2053(+)